MKKKKAYLLFFLLFFAYVSSYPLKNQFYLYFFYTLLRSTFIFFSVSLYDSFFPTTPFRFFTFSSNSFSFTVEINSSCRSWSGPFFIIMTKYIFLTKLCTLLIKRQCVNPQALEMKFVIHTISCNTAHGWARPLNNTPSMIRAV